MNLKYLQLGDIITFRVGFLMRLNIFLAKNVLEQLYNSGNMILLQLMNVLYLHIPLGYGLYHRRIGVKISGRGKRIFSFHSVQTGCGANPAPYTMGTGGCFALSKAAGA
jgi:hypothetical protein